MRAYVHGARTGENRELILVVKRDRNRSSRRLLDTVPFNVIIGFSRLIGAKVVTTLFLFALILLILINIYYSIKISGLTDQVKDSAQELALHRRGHDEAAGSNQAPHSE